MLLRATCVVGSNEAARYEESTTQRSEAQLSVSVKQRVAQLVAGLL